MLYHALTFSLSIVYISHFFVYLSAISFTAVISIYHIDIHPVKAESILQGIMAIGGLFGAFIPVVVLPRMSRRYSYINSGRFCSVSIYFQSVYVF
jgi:hypothetical protein